MTNFSRYLGSLRMDKKVKLPAEYIYKTIDHLCKEVTKIIFSIYKSNKQLEF